MKWSHVWPLILAFIGLVLLAFLAELAVIGVRVHYAKRLFNDMQQAIGAKLLERRRLTDSQYCVEHVVYRVEPSGKVIAEVDDAGRGFACSGRLADRILR